MFGMLRVPKGYLQPFEQQVFQAHYCGLCQAMGRRGFAGLRLATSYDGAALALFFSALSKQEVSVLQKPCPFSPWRKKPMPVGRDEVFDFAATASLGIVKLKAADEIGDGCGALKKALLRLVETYLGKKTPDWEEFTVVQKMQTELEKESQPWFDELSFPSGLLIGSLAARAAQENARNCVLARRVGENLGKWIYTWDALWDYADDKKLGRFNAIAAVYGLAVPEPRDWPGEVLQEMDFVLDRCLGEILNNIQLLDLGDPGEILSKLITGAHNWHKRSFVQEFYYEEEAYERLPRNWRPCGSRQAEDNGTRVEQAYTSGSK